MKALPPPDDEPEVLSLPSEILTKAGDVLTLQPDGTYKKVHNKYWNKPYVEEEVEISKEDYTKILKSTARSKKALDDLMKHTKVASELKPRKP